MIRKALFSLYVGISLYGHCAKADLPLNLPAPAIKPAVNDARIDALLRQNSKFPTYSAYRELAERYVQLGLYDEAARAYRQEAALYRRNRLSQAAQVQEAKAARYDSQVRIFMDREVTAEEASDLYTGATLEPRIGTYLGAYIDLDDQLKAWKDAEGRDHRKPEDFEKIIGKPHGTYFMYIAYGKPVPIEWLLQCKRAGVIAHLAFEPNDLNAVRDDDYLRTFAKTCGELQVPIFLRYASEMNGDWTDWHGKPELYRQKFRIVHQVFKRYAPLVATVWCVNSVPTDTIMDYYPGDDACDWVGINVYSVPFYGNDPKRPGLQDSALPFIDPIYKRFSAKKPIAICEFASSHMASVDKVPRSEFAVTRMAYLYNALPRFYPRIKMISWFDVNTIRHGSKGAPNNYALTEDNALLAAYREVVKPDYFLTTPQNRQSATAAPSPSMPRLLFLGQQVKGKANLSIWVKTIVDKPRVYLALNNNVVYAREGNGIHTVPLDTDALTPGRKRVRVYVYDDQNRFIATAATTITVGNARVRGNQPLQISGTIQRYYINRAGLVSAMDVQTLGAMERVHFEPTLAAGLTASYPVFSEINAWVLTRTEDQPVPGVEKSWNLLGMGEEEPEYDPRKASVSTDIELLDAEPAAAAPGAEAKGILTDVVRNDAGDVVGLVLDNVVIVRVSPALRAGKGAADATTISLGNAVSVVGSKQLPADGQISIYNQRLSATEVSVNGRKATGLKFAASQSRGIRATAPEAADEDASDREVEAAQSEGLDVYLPPLPAGARFSVRSTDSAGVLRELGIDPLVDANKRPW